MSVFSVRKSLTEYSGWIIAFGVLNVIFGAIALVFTGAFTLASVAMFGALWLVSGVAEIVLGIKLRAEGGMWFHILMGVLTVVVGAIILIDPAQNAVVLTLLIAILFLVGGLVKVVGSLADRGPHWGRLAVNGLISVILGGLIFWQWPLSSVWVIGTLVGCDFLVFGAMLLSLGFAVRKPKIA